MAKVQQAQLIQTKFFKFFELPPSAGSARLHSLSWHAHRQRQASINPTISKTYR
jgi:hypothetical protein